MIRQVEAELLHSGGRTDGQRDRQRDMAKLIAPFSDIENAPK